MSVLGNLGHMDRITSTCCDGLVLGDQGHIGRILISVVLRVLGHIGRIAGTSVLCRAVLIAFLISNATLVFWVLRGKEGYVSMSLRCLAERFHKACSVWGGC